MAPSEGVLVVAPESNPSAATMSMPPRKCMSKRHRDPQQHHGHRQQVKLQARFAEGGEETRPKLKADGIDEQDQAELADKLEDFGFDVESKVTEE